MSFTVVAPFAAKGTYETPFVLEQDRGNDFGFRTLYHLHLSNSAEGKPALIGDVRILKRGQVPSGNLEIKVGLFEHLTEEFCSLGISLDYYEHLSALPADVRDMALTGLRDIVRFPDFAEGFREEPGWSTSLFRDMSEPSFLELARVILDRNYSALPRLDLERSFEMPGASPFMFRFGLSKNRFATELPRRIAVLIGRNGVGKSTLLARFARIAHAAPQDRSSDLLSSLGRIRPDGIGFTRIIAINFSAFDSFQVPGVDPQERLQIASDIDSGTGRYIFCGVRDISQELRAEVETTPGGPAENRDRRERTLLKTNSQMLEEFRRMVDSIKAGKRESLFTEVMTPLRTDVFFGNISDGKDDSLLNDSFRDTFTKCSTGHKIVLHVIASLVAYTQPKSIVLYDEPETYLHPPLLAALMHSIRIVLERQDAFAIIATHSPVVLQETLARHVQVIRREGNSITAEPPAIQTFGESIGTLTAEVFVLTTNVTDYHTVLERLSRRYADLDQIKEVFDGEISMQSTAYLMSLFAQGE